MYFTCQWPSKLTGDVTLAWTEDQSDMMAEIIEKKMAEGFTFFILDDGGREVRLRKIGDLKSRSITMGDKDAEMLIKNGKIGIVDVASVAETTSEAPPRSRRTKSAREAATSQTAATRPMAGG